MRTAIRHGTMAMNLPPAGFPAPNARFRQGGGAFGQVQAPVAERKADSPFAHFVRYVSPTPPPGKWEFYWRELKSNFRQSREEGRERYQEQLIKNEKTRLKALVLTLTFGVGFAAFRRLRRTFSTLFMLTLLSYPVVESTRTFPKLEQAYEQIKNGNPSLARKTFRNALGDSVYSIFQDFMKPLTFGMVLGMVLSLPAILKGEGPGLVEKFIRRGADALRLTYGRECKTKVGRKLHGTAWSGLNGIHKLSGPVITWGDRVSNRIRQFGVFGFRPIDWMERG